MRIPLSALWGLSSLLSLASCTSGSSGPATPGQDAGAVDSSLDGKSSTGDAAVTDAPTLVHDGGDSGDSAEGAESGEAGEGGDGGPPADAARDAGLVPLVACCSEMAGGTDIALDTASVYWTDYAADGSAYRVMKVAKTGGTPTTLYASASVRPYGVAVDATSVYFSTGGLNLALKVPLDGLPDGSAAVQLASDVNGSGSIAVDGVALYYTQASNAIASVSLDGGGEVLLVDPTGASPTDPVVNMPIGFPGISGLTTDGTNVYYAAGQSYGGTVPSTSPLAYSGWLLGVPVGGGTPQILSPDQQDAGGGETYVHFGGACPSVQGGFVYWANGTSGFVYREAVDGGTPQALVSSQAARTNAVSDGTSVYYLGATGLMKAPIAGGAPVEILHDEGAYQFGVGGYSFHALAVDDASVYLFYAGGGGIARVAK